MGTLFKLALGYCVVICLPWIHSELDAAIRTRCIHYNCQWWLFTWAGLQGNKGQVGGSEGEHITTQECLEKVTCFEFFRVISDVYHTFIHLSSNQKITLIMIQNQLWLNEFSMSIQQKFIPQRVQFRNKIWGAYTGAHAKGVTWIVFL